MAQSSKKTTKPVEEAVVVEPVAVEKPAARSFSMGAIFWGFAFIGIGVMLLLDNLGIVDVHLGNLWQLWPVLLIGAGISMLSLRGWLAALVSLVMVAALGLLSWLVAVDNPYYGSNSSWSSEQVTSVGEDIATDAKQLDLTLKTGAIDLTLNSKSSENGYTAELNSSHLSLSQSSGDVRDGIQYATITTESKNNWWIGPIKNNMSVALTEQVPLSLRVDTGASSVSGDLSGAQLQSLTLKAGASSIDLKFGALVKKLDIAIDAGASSVKLSVPKDTGVRVETDNGLSHTSFEGVDKQSDGVYESKDFAKADKQIVIKAKVGVSSFEVTRY